MNRLDIHKYASFSELPLESFHALNFSVYVLDLEWNYLFVNDFVKKNLNLEETGLVGKNMWEHFKELTQDSSFLQLKSNTERGLHTNIITTSPLTAQRLNIIGHPLSDCYFFSASILPNKEDLMAELRNQLRKN